MARITSTQSLQTLELSNAAIQNFLQVLARDSVRDADVSERIQQQLAKINEDENLIAGERHYDG